MRPLCPTPAEQAKGPDWLEHSKYSPLHAAPIPAGVNRARLISELTSAIKSQQPLRILGGVARDSVRLFAVTRTPNPWVTPLSRWQFQTHYPTYPHWVTPRPGERHRRRGPARGVRAVPFQRPQARATAAAPR